MNTTRQPLNDVAPGATKRRWWWAGGALALVVLVAAIAVAARARTGADRETQSPLFAVAQGPLTISVTASGSIRNADAVTLKNEVEGSTTILYLVEEGTMVKKGDLLVELDSSGLQDNKVDQEIKVQSADAAYVTAREAVVITKKQGEADVTAAKVDLELAKLDLKKYVGDRPEINERIKNLGVPDDKVVNVLAAVLESGTDAAVQAAKQQADLEAYLERFQGELDGFEGEYKQELQAALNKIRISLAELMRAKDKLNGSIRLASKGYITETEKKADELDVQKRQSELQLAMGDMRLLMQFTFQRESEELMEKVRQMEFEVEKAESEARSDLVDAEATLTAKELTLKREREKLDKYNLQITKCKLYAPADGMVVHGTSGTLSYYSRDEPLAEGIQVRERQELIRIPSTSGGMVADVKIHESSIDKVREGLPVIITSNAVPDRRFFGHVRKVAIVPDAADRYMNPNAKTYNTEVLIEDTGKMLKPGMSCNTEIVVEQHEEATYIPVQAVLRVGAEPTVFVADKDGRPERRPVTVGLDNSRMIVVASGLKPGEKVLLKPPLPAATKPDQTAIPAEVLASMPEKPDGETAAPSPREPQPERGAPPQTANAGGEGPATGGGRGGFGNLSEEQRAAMRSRFIAAIPEEHREKVQAMTDQERSAWFQSEEGRSVMQKIGASFGGGRRGPNAVEDASAAGS